MSGGKCSKTGGQGVPQFTVVDAPPISDSCHSNGAAGGSLPACHHCTTYLRPW